MSHLAEGTVRRMVDEPNAISDADRAHLADCPRCRRELDAVRADRDLVSAALSGQPLPHGAVTGSGHLDSTHPNTTHPNTTHPNTTELDGRELDGTELDRAWARLETGVHAADQVTPRASAAQPRSRRRWLLRRPMVGVGVAALVAVGTTAAAAAVNWLPIFHPAAVTPVTFQLKDLTSLPDLTAYGSLSLPRAWEPQRVTDAATATARTGIAAPVVATLPTGVTGAPQYAVLPTATARFTFSAAKARATAAAHGQALPAMPEGVDGSSLRLDVGPGVVETWTQEGAMPALTVVRMAAPTASSEGVSLATLEGYLLAQPGIPADLAAQIRALPINGSVMPIPVPSDLATSTATTVNGAPATLVKLRSQAAGGLVWIRDGHLNAVVGLLSDADLRKVAGGLG